MEAVKKDFPAAAQIYKRNCDELDFPRSCHIFGSYSMTGKGLPKADALEVGFSLSLKTKL